MPSAPRFATVLWSLTWEDHIPLRFFHHIRSVATITDAAPAQCENHSEIMAAKPVPASRGGTNAPKEPSWLLFENQKAEKADAPVPKVEPHIAAILR